MLDDLNPAKIFSLEGKVALITGGAGGIAGAIANAFAAAGARLVLADRNASVAGRAETLRAATIHAAHVLRMDGRLGVVAPGATADLLRVDGNPLQDITVLTGQGERLALIVQNGKVVKDAGAPAPACT